MPVGLCLALNLAFGNTAYTYLSVSFIQMLKAFTPAVVMALGVICGLEKAEFKVSLQCFES